jgi:hypothetical protein
MSISNSLHRYIGLQNGGNLIQDECSREPPTAGVRTEGNGSLSHSIHQLLKPVRSSTPFSLQSAFITHCTGDISECRAAILQNEKVLERFKGWVIDSEQI